MNLDNLKNLLEALNAYDPDGSAWWVEIDEQLVSLCHRPIDDDSTRTHMHHTNDPVEEGIIQLRRFTLKWRDRALAAEKPEEK